MHAIRLGGPLQIRIRTISSIYSSIPETLSFLSAVSSVQQLAELRHALRLRAWRAAVPSGTMQQCKSIFITSQPEVVNCTSPVPYFWLQDWWSRKVGKERQISTLSWSILIVPSIYLKK